MTHPLFEDTRRLRSQPLFQATAVNSQLEMPANRAQIEHLVPHRDPFLLLDRIDILDVDLPVIACHRWIDPADPILAGHFPGNPIYPGALQGEMIFQACLALLWFLVNETTQIPASPQPLEAVATSVDQMTLLAPVHPGDHVTILAGLVEYDSLLATGIGQILVGDRICTYGTGDFYVT